MFKISFLKHIISPKLMALLLICFYYAHSALYSRQTHGTSWYGNAELKSNTKRIVVHPFFLDIEEDVVLAPSSWGSQPPDNLNTLEIYGNFTLPSQSVVTGVLIWNGDNILEGKIKGKNDARSQYETVVDRQLAPPPKPRDPVIIEKISTGSYNYYTGLNEDSYSISIYPFKWGEARKIRIRYLCPQRYINNELYISIPGTFIEGVSILPKDISISCEGAEGINSFSLYQWAKRYSVHSDSLSTNVILPYKTNFPSSTFVNYSIHTKLQNKDESMCAKTGFNDGLWKGNYVMYWGKPPDSLLINSGLRREIFFLWKWNFSNTFVYNDNSGKRLSPYGQEAINQSRQIKAVAQNITDKGDKVGLLLDQGNPQINKFFTLCKKSTSTYDSMGSFLSHIDSSFFLSNISGVAPPIKIRIDENDRGNFFKTNAESFDISLKLICTVFSKNDKVIKHIVLISAGPVPEMPNLEDYYLNSDSLLKDKITISAYGSSPRYPTGYWPGVPLYKIVESHALVDNGITYNGIWQPAKKEAFFDVTMGNSSNSFTRKLSSVIYKYPYSYKYIGGRYVYDMDTIPVDTTFFSGHSFSQWQDQVSWNAYDSIGNKIGSYNYVPYTINSPQDTFIAKLWAGTNNPVAEGGYESNRGARFGVVDAQYSLLALESDTLSPIQKTQLAEKGLPFLSDDEIFLSQATTVPVKKMQVFKGTRSLSIVQLCSGLFKIILPSNCNVEYIKVFNLQGKTVLVIKRDELLNKSELTLNMGRFSKGVYQLVAMTSKGMLIKSFSIL